MMMSEPVAALAAALVKAQADMQNPPRNGENPHFRSRYATLSGVRDAIQKPLSEAGIAVVQFARWCLETGLAEVETMLIHAESGEWMRETLHIPVAKCDAHGIGSAITYGRRYGLISMIGLAPEDDDANEAVAVAVAHRPPRARTPEADMQNPPRNGENSYFRSRGAPPPLPARGSARGEAHAGKLPEPPKAADKRAAYLEEFDRLSGPQAADKRAARDMADPHQVTSAEKMAIFNKICEQIDRCGTESALRGYMHAEATVNAVKRLPEGLQEEIRKSLKRRALELRAEASGQANGYDIGRAINGKAGHA